MPTYKMSASEFIRKSRDGTMDYVDFSDKLKKRMQQVNRRNSLLKEITDIKKGVALEPQLFGLPVVVSDGICIRGFKASAGSMLLKNYQPQYDATVIAKVRDSSGALAGKTNQDELGICKLGTNCAYALPQNPADEEKAAGCCSAAALVSALEMPLVAFSHSSCGSICSSAWSRTFSFLPEMKIEGALDPYTSNLRHGLIEGAASLERVAIHAKSAADIGVLSGIFLNGTSSGKDVSGMNIAIVNDNNDKEFWGKMHKLESHGAILKKTRVDFENTEDVWLDIISSEASFNAKRYAAMNLGGKAKIKFQPSHGRYRKALEAKEECEKRTRRILRNYDLIASPAMSQGPPEISEAKKLSMKDILRMHSSMPLVMAGTPAIVCGGVAVTGKSESGVFSLANVLEK
ncbi:MAG: hypothetical protein HYW25_02940 [Candidatus Aenigmarchaeota archaeon]|nr:hypothetical protein [Candidatus Aenigmarchaeota archaeon]